MRNLLLITLFLLLQSFPSFGKVGDGYICKPIQSIVSVGKDFMITTKENLSHPIQIKKFVWLKKSIKFNELNLEIPITKNSNEYFESYDGLNKITFRDGFMIWTSNQQIPTLGFSVTTYNCEKF